MSGQPEARFECQCGAPVRFFRVRQRETNEVELRYAQNGATVAECQSCGVNLVIGDTVRRATARREGGA